MPSITIFANEFDTEGSVTLFPLPGADLDTVGRRVTKSGTLDGGAFINDLGYSDSDRDFEFVIPRFTKTQLDTLKTMVRTYSSLSLACSEGVFTGTVDRLTAVKDMKIRFRVLEKTSA